ncbi:MAG: putative Iron-regulated protein precursor [Myxococcaceae bacterium]|nr:putative Iron-regulated protein precursor [Myxococcaceae bacterium]
MKWLRFSPLVLSLLAACDKTVPFENTAPSKMPPAAVPSMDGGSFVLLDAQIGPSDGATAPEIPAEKFTKAELLRQIADCSLGRFREFNELAAALQVATTAWAANPTDELRSAAQLAWRAAMSSWQQAELFRFGPSGPGDVGDHGAQDYRNAIYFFPYINLCLVDQTLLSGGFSKLPLSLNVSAKGLGALEYLLFYDGTTNACSSGIAINTGAPSPWQQLAASDLHQRRAAFAGVLGTDLAATAQALLDAWDPAKGNFYAQLAGAGTEKSSPYGSEQEALNNINTAMLYVDKQLKDDKVGIPAGLVFCAQTTCPEAVESRYSQASNLNIVQNLHAFRSLFQGCGGNYTGLGFDDWLIETHQPDLANRMINALEVAQQAASALPLPLEQLLSTNLSQVVALYRDISGFESIFKAEYRGALNFTPPQAAVGDND